MAKRKTPKSKAAAEAIPPEAAHRPEISAAVPLAVPDIIKILAGATSPGAPEASESSEIVQSMSMSEEAAGSADLSDRFDHDFEPGPEAKADAKTARAAPWGTSGVYHRAASIAVAAAFGAVLGSLAPVAFDYLMPSANAEIATPAPTDALAASVERLTAEFAALKADGEEADRTVEARLTALTERFDGTAKTQGELAAKVAEMATTLSARPTTAAAVSDEATGSVTPQKPAIADGWTLWRVYNGRALVEGHGRLYDVMPGADLPGLGAVKRIQRSEGRWIVVTQNGIIVSRRG